MASIAADGFARRRVRTPGKHIVAFMAGAVLIVGAAASVLKAVEGPAPARPAGDPLAPVRAGPVVYAPLDTFLVDLAPDFDGRVSYLKLDVSIAASGPDAERVAQRVDEVRPEIEERIAFLLRGLRPDDLQGAEGMARAKAEMLRRVNIALAPDAADDVLITSLVIQ